MSESYVSQTSKVTRDSMIEVAIVDDTEFQGVSDFEKSPVTVIIGSTMMALTIAHAERLCGELNRKLASIDHGKVRDWDGIYDG